MTSKSLFQPKAFYDSVKTYGPNLDSWDKFLKRSGMNTIVVTDGGLADAKTLSLEIVRNTTPKHSHGTITTFNDSPVFQD